MTENTPIVWGATVGMVADIVREVGGDRVEVTNIIGAGVDPHVYSPTRSDVAVLLRSDIVFYSGLLLEGQMTDVLAKVGRRRPVIPVTERLKAAELIQNIQTAHHDPHVWMDVQGWMKAVEVVRDTLIDFDPDNADGYQVRAERYLAELNNPGRLRPEGHRLHPRKPAGDDHGPRCLQLPGPGLSYRGNGHPGHLHRI